MFKSNLVAGIFGLVLVCGFTGFLLFWLKSWPLGIIIVGVALLIVYDLFLSLKETNDASGG